MNSNPVSRAIYSCPELRQEEETALAHIADVQERLKYYVAEPRRWVTSVRRVLAARAIQGSNSIEGYNVSVEDAVAAIQGDAPTEAEGADWHAVDSYRRAMTYVLQLARDEHFEFAPTMLRSLHFMMTEYDMDASPGLWRPGGIWIRNDQTGETVYQGPAADDVPPLVDLLVADLRSGEQADVPAMVRAAMAHLNLVMIHPFRDGNGRMARCLQTLVLALEGVLVAEFCSIEEYLGVNTQKYYDILASTGRGKWSPTLDARPWVRFCLEAHYVQAVSVLRRVEESEKIWAHLEDAVARAGLADRTIEALFPAQLGMRVRNAPYRSAVRGIGEEISVAVATNDLRSLVDAGLLVKHGAKRGTSYVAATPLLTFRQQLMRDRRPIHTDHLFDPGRPPTPTLFEVPHR